MKKSFLHTRLVFLFLTMVVIGIAIRILFPPYFNLQKMVSEGNMTPYELFNVYVADPPFAHSLYSDQPLLLEGAVTSVGDGFVRLGQDMRIIKCKFRHSIYDRKVMLSEGDQVIIKGICRGITLTEVLMTHCIVIKQGLSE